MKNNPRKSRTCSCRRRRVRTSQDREKLCDFVPTVDLSTWQWHFGVDVQNWFLTPFVGSSIIMLCFWLCTYWMYRNKVFLKV